MFGYMFTLITGRKNGEDRGGLQRSLASLFQRGRTSLYGPAPVSKVPDSPLKACLALCSALSPAWRCLPADHRRQDPG